MQILAKDSYLVLLPNESYKARVEEKKNDFKRASEQVLQLRSTYTGIKSMTYF